ncbi:hypothetical protein EJ06DRAFT_531367 [Trichodelitschia bisporula]|uniref:Uncharacterized protein n=1 Tax=Trichodelitschia bisporula TaxID=703511 RepID=A0A6G1HT99_9PEZI|nr:hypothetical protein EJ06DRAFT_531367 [Trichodelitschia bisporula]
MVDICGGQSRGLHPQAQRITTMIQSIPSPPYTLFPTEPPSLHARTPNTMPFSGAIPRPSPIHKCSHQNQRPITLGRKSRKMSISPPHAEPLARARETQHAATHEKAHRKRGIQP